MKNKGHLNLRTKIDLLKLSITTDFLAQLVFVFRVILHEINEILGKVSGFDQFRFGTEKSSETSDSSKEGVLMHIGSEDNGDETDDEERVPVPINPTTAPSTYKMVISIKLTNYDGENALLFYSKPLINPSLNIELSLESMMRIKKRILFVE